MYSSSVKRTKMNHALRTMDKAITGTEKHLGVMGPARSKQIVDSLRDAFQKVEGAAQKELQDNQQLREEFHRQNRKIGQLEEQVKQLQLEMREEKERCERTGEHLQNQIDEITKELEDRDEHMEFLLENVREALEAAVAVYDRYRQDEIDNDGE